MIDIPGVRNDTDRAAPQELFQPLFGDNTIELAHLGCIDSTESDALVPHANGIAVDHADQEGAQQFHFRPRTGSKRGEPNRFMAGSQFVPPFRVALWSAVGRAFMSWLFVRGEAIRPLVVRRWVPAQIAVLIQS